MRVIFMFDDERLGRAPVVILILRGVIAGGDALGFEVANVEKLVGAHGARRVANRIAQIVPKNIMPFAPRFRLGSAEGGT